MPPDPSRVLLIACGALAREVLALKAANDWDHLALECLPAQLHLTPAKIPSAVEAKIISAKSEGYAEIFILYADCGTGGILDAVCEKHGVRRIAGPHCYAFFDGVEAFAKRDEVTAFYLTDFLARHFDSFVWKPMGFDRHPELIPMMFGNYERLIYLAQTDDPELDAAAQDAAARLELRYERRFTGYGDMATALAGLGSDIV